MTSRMDILTELEKELYCPVGSIVYHDESDIKWGDWERIVDFFNNFTKKENLALILHGEGGHPIGASKIALYLRQIFNRKLITLIPEKAASAMSYIWLVSNEAWFCSNTVATQINIVFHNGRTWICPKEHLRDDDTVTGDISKLCYDTDYNLLKKILYRKDTIMGGRLSKQTEPDLFIDNIFERTHKRDTHDYPLTIKTLQDYGFNIKKPEIKVERLLKDYVNSAKADILGNKKSYLCETKRE